MAEPSPQLSTRGRPMATRTPSVKRLNQHAARSCRESGPRLLLFCSTRQRQNFGKKGWRVSGLLTGRINCITNRRCNLCPPSVFCVESSLRGLINSAKILANDSKLLAKTATGYSHHCGMFSGSFRVWLFLLR